MWLWQWFLHVTGADDTSGTWYGFWSGFGSDIGEFAIAGALVGVIRRHNCQQKRCWRIGRHPFTNPDTGVIRLLCWKHHPDVSHKRLTGSLVKEMHARQLYLGKRPGRG